ncbi:MAG: acyl dehydratase [Dehalococcoidales bacterium]|jgi:acyl dehydratase|nr:acyl dehydratase [Dehalococcoidales bacterium]|tara:strand:+ start:90 stop:524 length:435 start_codon:yes stop_codon:yes gene_type:complete
MKIKVSYEDVDVGAELTTLVKQPTAQQLVMWAGASGDYNPIHYDKDFAQSRGLPGVVVHGQLVGCFLGQMMTDWIGEQGKLKNLTLTYRGMNFPSETLICKATVAKKYVEGKEHLVVCNIWTENPKGEKTVTGTAVVILPSGGL